MRFVIDANIIFSMAKQDSATNKLIFDKEIELFAPEYALEELKKYSKLIEDKYKINFIAYFNKIKSQIKFVPATEYKDKIVFAKQIIKDQKDISYFALALKYNLPIWSNDTEFKNQNIILVFNTKELITIM